MWFNFGKGEKEIEGKLVLIDHPTEVWVCYTYNVREQPHHVCYFKKRNQLVMDVYPPLLYSQYPIPTYQKKKAKDLKSMSLWIISLSMPKCQKSKIMKAQMKTSTKNT